MPEVLVIQHIGIETIGTIADALAVAEISHETLHPYRGDMVPDWLGEARGLIVMGGPMGVCDQERLPHLKAEIRLIRNTIKEGKPILGICLGSQLLAHAIGAPVTKGLKKEIGWRPVTLTGAATTDPLFQGIQSPFTPLHWHGEIFDLPPGAVHLASSELTRYQAFRHGPNAYGLLFHIEPISRIVHDLVKTFREELDQEGIKPEEITEQAQQRLKELRQMSAAVFSRWAKLLQPTPTEIPHPSR